MKRLLNGHLSLPITFWLFLILPNIIFQGLSILSVPYVVEHDISKQSFQFYFMLLYSINLPLCRACWLSANRYVGNKVWPILVKLYVIWILIRFLAGWLILFT